LNFLYVKYFLSLLVSKRGCKEKNDGTENTKSEHREKSSSKVSGVGCDHLRSLCDTASGNINDTIKRHLGCLHPSESRGAHCGRLLNKHERKKERCEMWEEVVVSQSFRKIAARTQETREDHHIPVSLCNLLSWKSSTGHVPNETKIGCFVAAVCYYLLPYRARNWNSQALEAGVTKAEAAAMIRAKRKRARIMVVTVFVYIATMYGLGGKFESDESTIVVAIEAGKLQALLQQQSKRKRQALLLMECWRQDTSGKQLPIFLSTSRDKPITKV